ncbi:MAG TPA: hypothetical protein VMU14_13105 [Acidimicrobiales bacterium]|nr:hypothetical protein [Acidimicrobiales bacterium]
MTTTADPPQGGQGGGGRARTGLAPDPFEGDREALIAFVTEVRGLLRRVIRSGWLPDGLQPGYLDAYEAVIPDLELVVAQLERPAIGPYLAVAGMTGELGAHKLRVFGWLLDRAPQGIKATLIALKAADHVLGSLLQIPGVEGLHEFKQLVESGLEAALYLIEPDAPSGQQPEEGGA